MCGRYVLVQKISTIEKRFNVSPIEGFDFQPNTNIAPGEFAPVITSAEPRKLQLMRFGLTPFWAKKPMYLINARTEGDHNPDNDSLYHGTKGIITKPAFRKPIRSQRCIVVADAFIEGPEIEKLNKPYIIYLRNKNRPFAIAGLYDEWHNPETDDITSSFSIITTVANELLLQIGHPRMPVILDRNDEHYWLDNNRDLGTITSLLKPYPAIKMNAYPVNPVIKNPKIKGNDLLQPIGETIFNETEAKVITATELHGMGARKKVRTKNGDWSKNTLD